MNQINLSADHFVGIRPNAAMDGTWLLQLVGEDGEVTQVKIHRAILDELAADIIASVRKYDAMEWGDSSE